MRADLVAVDLRTRRRSIIGYSLGMALYTLVVVALYPAFKDASDLDEMLAEQPGLSALFGINEPLSTPSGWLSGNIYANFLPLILLFVTIGHGASTLAGEEGRGRLDLVLALPMSRRSVVIEKSITIAIGATVVALVTFLTSLAGRAFDVDVDIANLATTTLGTLLLALTFGFLALAVGGANGERGSAIAIASAVAASMYLLSSLAPLVEWLEPWRVLSLFYWSVGNAQLTTGLGWDGLFVLVASTSAALVLALVTFERHDVSA